MKGTLKGWIGHSWTLQNNCRCGWMLLYHSPECSIPTIIAKMNPTSFLKGNLTQIHNLVLANFNNDRTTPVQLALPQKGSNVKKLSLLTHKSLTIHSAQNKKLTPSVLTKITRSTKLMNNLMRSKNL